MKLFSIAALLAAFTLLSCGEDKPALKNGDTVFFPDTAAFISSWKMEEHKMLSELFAADTFYNQLGLDTFGLTYSNCDCPDWIDKTKGDIDCKECTDFYIEPADPSLMLPDAFGVSGNTVIFYGVRIPGMNLPAGRQFTVPDPPAWTVIHYYGYTVTRPYKVHGPEMQIFQSGDTVSYPVEVRIR